MAITTTLSDQLSQVSQFQNEDIKIYVSSVDFNTLSALYQRDKKKYEDNFNTSTTNTYMDVWQNSLAKTFAICAYGEIIRDDETKTASFHDVGKYELVAFAANGRPIKITPSFSEVDPNSYLSVGKTTDSNENPYTYLYLDLPKVSEWISNNEDSASNKKLENTYAYLWNSYQNLHTYMMNMEQRLRNIESALTNHVVWRYCEIDQDKNYNYHAPSYLWTGTQQEFKEIQTEITPDTTYVIQ